MAQRLIVSNNNDSGRGSLREAIRASQRGTGSFEIIFRGNNPANRNNLGLSEFTIALRSPLPIIYRNNVRINTIDPRNVNLIPEPSARSANAGPGPMQQGAQANGSLLYVGDTRFLTTYRHGHVPPPQNPNVVLNNINFLSNVARGGNGSGNGGGGGAGIGGGISLTNGHLTVTNSQFQGLSAVGGRASGGRAAHGSRFRRPRRNDWRVFFDQRRGQDGGTGGISSIPWRTNSSGDPRYRQTSFPVPVGGRGGWDLNPPRRRIRGEWNEDEFWGTFGFPGQNGRNGDWVGEGGGGGAGGGHPGMVNNHVRGHLAVWSGSGGQRGVAGELGGHGASGQTAPYARVNARHRGNPVASNHHDHRADPPSRGPRNGRDDQGFHYEVNWRPGQRRSPGKWERGRRVNHGPAPAAHNARNGSGFGNAIAILGEHARRHTGGRRMPDIMTTLDLINVDFVNAGGGNGRGRGIIQGDRNNRIRLNNVRFGANINSLRPLLPGNINAGPFHGGMQTLPNVTTNNSPTYRAVSTPRLTNVLDTPNPELRAKHDTAELFHIDFEQASGFAGIVTDISDPDNVFNQLWRDVVPDREDEIISRFQAETNSTFNDLAGNAVRSVVPSVTNNLIGRVTSAAIAAVPQPARLGLEGALGARDLIRNLLNDQASARATRSAINRRREQALAENLERQERLHAELKSHRNASVGEVNLTQERSVVHIHNFTLGEDTIILPRMSGDIAPSFVGAVVGGNIAPAIEFRSSDGTNGANHFLTVHLSNESLNEFRRIGNQEINSIINLLHIDENGNRVLGTRGKRVQFIDNPNYRGDIGRIQHIVDRQLIGFDDSINFNIITSVSSDTIYGSVGAEVIRSNQGDDIVFPTAGRTPEDKVHKDEVFGGVGDDIVSYAADLVELDLRSIPGDDNSSKVRVFDQDVEIGVLEGFENFHLFGASNINLSELGKFDTKYSSHYTICTGSGGTIKGSSHDDVVMLSYNDQYNSDVASAYKKTSFIEGSSGFDRLYLDFSTMSGEFEVTRLPGQSNFVVTHEGNSLVLATDVEAVDIQTKNQSYNFTISQLEKDFSSQDEFLFLAGSRSGDTTYGGAYNDNIRGYDGDDTLVAGSGSDELIGGEGNNMYLPGSGDDRINLNPNSSDVIGLKDGNDEITNFGNNDKLAFEKIKKLNVSRRGQETADTNVIVGTNSLQYRNDNTSVFNTVEFTNKEFSSALWKAVDNSPILLLDSNYASTIYNSL